MEYVARGKDALVEREFRRWLLKQKRTDEKHWPTVTLSVEYAALPASFTRDLAAHFGFEAWTDELLKAMAEQSGLPEHLLKFLDSHSHSTFDDWLDSAIVGGQAREEEYERVLRTMLKTLEERGSGVILGRGAHCVIDETDALRVCVVSPMEHRLRHLIDAGLDRQDAEDLIYRKDRHEAEFLQQHFGRQVRDPECYDITINSRGLTPAAVLDLITIAYRDKFGRLPEMLEEGSKA